MLRQQPIQERKGSKLARKVVDEVPLRLQNLTRVCDKCLSPTEMFEHRSGDDHVHSMASEREACDYIRYESCIDIVIVPQLLSRDIDRHNFHSCTIWPRSCETARLTTANIDNNGSLWHRVQVIGYSANVALTELSLGMRKQRLEPRADSLV